MDLSPSAQASLSEALKKFAKPKFVLEDFLFKEQLDFVRCKDLFATACCSVRSGKSMACAADLIDTALRLPGTTGLYITLTRSSGKRILWGPIKKICSDYQLSVIPNEQELTLTFPNNSKIRLLGADNPAEIEKYRGLSDVAVAYIDEAQAFRAHIRELIEEILIKRLYDLNGRLRVIGTPGAVIAGYFYDICKSSQWTHFGWNMLQNPWLFKKSGKTPQELIDQDCKRKGVSIDDPSIQRECFGRWVNDEGSLLLHYVPDLNHYDELPKDKGAWSYVMGLDLGSVDSDSISVLGWTESSPNIYLVEEQLTAGQLTDDLARQVKALMVRYPISKILVDTGGLGLKISEDLKARHQIPCEPAKKTDKMANYKVLDDSLRTGRFKARSHSRFAQDCNILEKDRDKSTPDRIVVKGHSDAIDSALYAFVSSPAFAYVPKDPEPLPGSPEHNRKQQALHEEALIEQMKRDREMRDGSMSQWIKDKNGQDPWHSW